jgi:hypothetical protein
MTVATIRPVEPGEHAEDSAPIDPGATVGMFISWVWMKRAVTFHLEKCDLGAVDYELEFA